MPEALIRLENVTKLYGNKVAVRELSLEIYAGELFAFLGQNGAGKTTTIKMITGLLRATTGRVCVAGHDMTVNSIAARREISFVPDQPHLYGKLTGRDFLNFVRDIYSLPPAEAAEDQERLIDTFEMRDYVDNLIETYSHGMRQRVAFAGAFLHRPRVLVVDEPMVGLDPKSTRIVKDLLRASANAGAAVFMSTHTLAIAEEVADRVGIIHRGNLLRLGTVREVIGADERNLEETFLKVTAEADARRLNSAAEVRA